MDVQEFLQLGEAWGAGVRIDRVFVQRMVVRSIDARGVTVDIEEESVDMQGERRVTKMTRKIRRSELGKELIWCRRTREGVIERIERVLKNHGLGNEKQWKALEVLKRG